MLTAHCLLLTFPPPLYGMPRMSYVLLIEIIGHRGASHDAPENTLASFRLGWAQGADANELDLRLTRDGQIAVIHDATTRRIAGLERPVAAQTLAELQALDAGSWKGAAWAGEQIPALAEVLATVPDGKRLYLEIKCGVEVLPELERVIAEARKEAGATRADRLQPGDHGGSEESGCQGTTRIGWSSVKSRRRRSTR